MPLACIARACRAALFITALAASGCGGHDARAAADATSVEIASIDGRLRGTYRLVRFVPEVPLEPMLASLLEYQYATLVIRLDGKRIIADSPGVHVDRAYEIRDPKGDRFTIVSYDEAGIAYDSVCEFSGAAEVVIYAQTPPWKGVATVRRVR